MFGVKRVVVAEHERGIWMKDRTLVDVLGPGVYYQWDPLGRQRVQIYDLGVTEFRHPQLDVFLKEHAALCAKYFDVVELGDAQVGLVYKNNRLEALLPPSTRTVFWKGVVDVRVEVADIAVDFRVAKELHALLAHPRTDSPLYGKTAEAVTGMEVANNHVGLLIVDGELTELLQPGLHLFWRFGRKLAVELVDQRMQAMEVQGQEILTKDKVSLRVNLTANYRVSDPVKARSELGNFVEYLYRSLQFGLRQAVGVRTLDVLLGNKDELDQVIFDCVRVKAELFGLQVDSVGVKDVILPGDMKVILNQVVEAEKVAQANIIKRREETAATRSLLNTAKLMSENPTLLRLKELEALERVTDKIGSLTVFGGLDGVLNDMVRIQIPENGVT